jgi:hypothetical protein
MAFRHHHRAGDSQSDRVASGKRIARRPRALPRPSGGRSSFRRSLSYPSNAACFLSPGKPCRIGTHAACRAGTACAASGFSFQGLGRHIGNRPGLCGRLSPSLLNICKHQDACWNSDQIKLIEITAIEIGEARQLLAVNKRHHAIAKRQKFLFAKLAQHAVEVDRRHAQRVGEHRL